MDEFLSRLKTEGTQVSEAPELVRAGPNQGLPRYRSSGPPAPHEFWPLWVFYVPVVFYCLWLALRYRGLGLPMLANPAIPLGGMVGESKSEILALARSPNRAGVLPYIVHHKDCSSPATGFDLLQKKFAEAGLVFPCVAKPDKGCRGAGVRVVQSDAELRCYWEHFPGDRSLIVQTLSPHCAEFGLFYVRYPDEPRGTITSLTLKYRAVVEGDGQSTVEQLIRQDARAGSIADVYLAQLDAVQRSQIPAKGHQQPLAFPGSHCRGSIFRDGCGYITAAMEQKLDDVMREFPGIYFGRLDVKAAGLDSLMAGGDFDLIEINGTSSEQTHVWDARHSCWTVWRALCRQYRTAFEIGFALRKQGCAAPSLVALLKAWWAERANA